MYQSRHSRAEGIRFGKGVGLGIMIGLLVGIAWAMLAGSLAYGQVVNADVVSTARATENLPDAPAAGEGDGSVYSSSLVSAAPAIVAITSTRQGARSPIREPFLSNRLNRSLVAGDWAARLGDATSTRYYEKHNLGHEVGEPAFIAHSYLTQLPVSLGEAAINTFIADKLWQHDHRRIARVVLIVDIGCEVATDAHNYSLKRGTGTSSNVTFQTVKLEVGTGKLVGK